MLSFYIKEQSPKSENKSYPSFNSRLLKNIPVACGTTMQKEKVIIKVDLMLKLNSELREQSLKFQRTIQRKFELDVLPKKLQDWYKLTYAEFIKELNKLKVNLTVMQEAEWEDYFNSESQKLIELKSQIDQTDKEIDRMVYELYELTEEEIKIVENAF